MDAGFSNQNTNPQALVFPQPTSGATAAAWTLCTGAPQNVQYTPDVTGKYIYFTSYDTIDSSGTLPVFAPQDIGNHTPGNFFAFGRQHLRAQGFGGLYFGAGAQTCSLVTATNPTPLPNASTACTTGTLSGNCQITGPQTADGSPVFVAITH